MTKPNGWTGMYATETERESSVMTLYTTAEYVRDCVLMAREANSRGVAKKIKARMVISESFTKLNLDSAAWQFAFARNCIENARKAKSDFNSRRCIREGVLP